MNNAPAQTRTTEIVNQAVSLEERTIRNSLPSHISYDKFIANCNLAIMLNPGLMECTLDSLTQAFLQSAKDGLVCDNREATIVSYNSKRGSQWIKKAQYQVMVDGLLKRIRQSGYITKIDAKIVYKGDEFDYYNDLDGEHLMHRPNFQASRSKEDFLLVYARAKTTDGEVLVEVMTADDVFKVMQNSRGAIDQNTGQIIQGSVWDIWWDRMAIKSCLHRLGRRLPNSAEILESIERDIQVQSFAEQQAQVRAKTKPTPIQQKSSMPSNDEIEALKKLADKANADLSEMFVWVSQKTNHAANTFAELSRDQVDLLSGILNKRVSKQLASA